LKEETGIGLAKMEQFRVFDAVNRDPRGRTISVVFYAYLPEIMEARGDDDAALARWFPVAQLPQLGFDHSKIVSQFLASGQT
jgi:8-oxo-dGTP diphosphatase